MCGIAGLITRPGTTADPGQVRRMTGRMSHRGPDAEGIWAENNAAFGHRRLSIIDLNEGANQPLISHAGRYVIVFNGEIYNYRAVRAQLPNYPFTTQSDTEVIVAAYEQWGIDCLHRFNGMFALALWDRQTQELIVARDRLGKKPFYYYHDQHVFVFASEVRALLQTGLMPRQLNRAALPEYLMYQTVAAPYTLVEGIRQLPAGHYAHLSNHEWTEHPYWQLLLPRRANDALLTDKSSVLRQTGQLVRAAVARRLVSDVVLSYDPRKSLVIFQDSTNSPTFDSQSTATCG